MVFLWSDTLAALLIEHDRVAQDAVADWMARPVAHRLGEGQDPLALARGLLSKAPEEPPTAPRRT
jgi:hypothetical protein